MRDNEIFIMLRSLILDMLPDYGITDFGVKQNYQPTQQGRPNQTTLFITKPADKRYGSRRVDVRYDEDQQAIVQTQVQVIESTFRFAVLVSERDPANDTELTASDVLKAVAALIQSPDFMEAILEHEAQVLRVQEMPATPWSNDRDRFEFEPALDVVITHKNTHTKQLPAITTVRSGLHRG